VEEISIEQLKPAELTEAAELLGRAFSPTPNLTAILGGLGERDRRTAALFRVTIGHAPGQVFVAKKDGRIVGVMRMVEWPKCQMSLLRGLKHMTAMLNALGPAVLRGAKLRRVWSQHDPKESHWHLDPLGVIPELQGKGIGSKLLLYFCAEVDAKAQAAYLETDRQENVRLYERYGFSVVGEAKIIGVHNWFMWRNPRGDIRHTEEKRY
jgi:ribosomal protein S18 acetylase RimI-like enzyme